MMRVRTLAVLAAAAMIVIVAAATSGFAQSGAPPADTPPAAEPTREQLELQISIMQDYIRKLEARMKEQQPQQGTDEVLAAAYRQTVLKQYESINRQADFINSAFEDHRLILKVSLVLVALVIVSGLLFSAMQLWQSLRAATMPLSNDIEISASKVRLTTSVIGVIVLAISLAFFYIFITTNLRIERAGGESLGTPVAPK